MRQRVKRPRLCGRKISDGRSKAQTRLSAHLTRAVEINGGRGSVELHCIIANQNDLFLSRSFVNARSEIVAGSANVIAACYVNIFAADSFAIVMPEMPSPTLRHKIINGPANNTATVSSLMSAGLSELLSVIPFIANRSKLISECMFH